jgi:hypothetical protein
MENYAESVKPGVRFTYEHPIMKLILVFSFACYLRVSGLSCEFTFFIIISTATGNITIWSPAPSVHISVKDVLPEYKKVCLVLLLVNHRRRLESEVDSGRTRLLQSTLALCLASMTVSPIPRQLNQTSAR